MVRWVKVVRGVRVREVRSISTNMQQLELFYLVETVEQGVSSMEACCCGDCQSGRGEEAGGVEHSTSALCL